MKIYEVGGAVRDSFLGKNPRDIDYVVVGATAEKMLSLGFIRVGKSFPVFLHPETKSEYALARKETKTGEKHTDFAFDFSPEISLNEDLQRRDFTCNALAKDIETGEIIDEVGGLNDIKNKVLRHINAEHFIEDPLRVLRMCRFAAQLDFFVAPETMKLAQQMVASNMLKNLSAERFREEFLKALSSADFARFLITLNECGALKFLLPNFAEVFNKRQIRVLDLVKNSDTLLKFAVLFLEFNDVQKIKTDCKHIKMPERFCRFAIFLNKHLKYFSSRKKISDDYLFELIKELCRFKDFSALEYFFNSLQTLQIEYGKSFERAKKIFALCNQYKVNEMPDFSHLPKDCSLQRKYKGFILQKL